MKAQSLKNAILQLAVQGKLVPQNEQDEPAHILLEKIKAEKAQLVKDKKIKSEKVLPPITDEEKPFDIPENWEWVRLGDIVYNWGQKIPDVNFYYIDVGSINSTVGCVGDCSIIEPQNAPSRARKLVKDGTVIYSTVRPYLLNIAIIDNKDDKEFIASTAFAIMHPFEGVDNKYLFYYLRSRTFIDYVNSQMIGVAYPAINDQKLFYGIMPVPPLTEQHRIVEKIEHLMPLVNKYDRYEQELSALEVKFPQDLKKSVLQYAVQGKLVPQSEKDEPAGVLLEKIKAEKAQLIKDKKIKAEKPLPPIKDEEKPFDIPDSWEWARLTEIGIVVGGGTPKTDNLKNWQYGDIPWITPADMKNVKGKYVCRGNRNITQHGLSSSSAQLMPANSLLFSSRAPIGYIGIAKNELCTNQGFKSIVPIKDSIIPFIYYVLIALTPFIQSRASGTTFKEISGTEFGLTVIPVPSLAEQQRIVEKVESLLALCDTLADESKLKQYQLQKQIQKVIAFPAFDPEEEHLVAARADEISAETRTKEAERLAMLKRSRK